MKIDLEFAELQSPLFLAGTNHGLKLMVDKRPIRLVFDEVKDKLLVFFNGKVAIIPSANVASMTPINIDDIGKMEVKVQQIKKEPIKLGRPIKAQASTPMDHVFVDGPGKTRD